MALIVQKYGGTSVGSVERIKAVARRVARWKALGHQIAVVPSAMAGETNRLIGLAREIQATPDPRELDVVAATGEQVTIGLLSMALMDLGIKAKSYTGAQVRVVTDSAFTKARIVSIDEERLKADLAAGTVPVVAGLPGRRSRRQPDDARARRLRHVRGRAGGRAQGRRVPDLHRRRRRLHHRSPHRPRGAPAEDGHLRGDARDGEPRLEGAADPGGRVRRQIQGAIARPLELRGDGPGEGVGPPNRRAP